MTGLDDIDVAELRRRVERRVGADSLRILALDGLTAVEWVTIADALDLLASIDEGEHTDHDGLIELRDKILRRLELEPELEAESQARLEAAISRLWVADDPPAKRVLDLRLTPYGMDTCCIGDEPTTHAIPTDTGELLPYCREHAAAVKAEFPDVAVYLYERVELEPEADRPAG